MQRSSTRRAKGYVNSVFLSIRSHEFEQQQKDFLRMRNLELITKQRLQSLHPRKRGYGNFRKALMALSLKPSRLALLRKSCSRDMYLPRSLSYSVPCGKLLFQICWSLSAFLTPPTNLTKRSFASCSSTAFTPRTEKKGV